MADPTSDLLAWTDFETTGLDNPGEVPLEFCLLITDQDGNEIAPGATWLLWDDEYYESVINEAVPFVRDMHAKSGLWSDLDHETTFLPQEAQHLALDYLDEVGVPHGQVALAGNNVPFDRFFMKNFLPKLESHFHYRNVDISSIKELCRRHNPAVYAKSPVKNETHRALPDISESINEYKFYLDNFLWTA